ncbi:hypothetical protein GCM10010523_16150 [Paenarthrobacter ilicis]
MFSACSRRGEYVNVIQDHVTGYEDGWKLRGHYVRGTYAVLDSAGRNAHLERPELTAALVKDWLARTGTAAR